MKKWILALLVILVLFFIGVYVFIPAKITVSSAAKIGASENGAVRFLLDEKKWPTWWKDSSGDLKQSAPHFIAGNDTFMLSELYHMSAAVTIQHEDRQVNSRMLLVSLSTDTTGIEWSYNFETSNNPFTRFAQYRQALAIKKNIDKVIRQAKSFLEKPENVYGLSLLRTSIKDTLLISTKNYYPSHPNTPVIYSQVALLKEYAEKNGAVQTGNPIFHVTKIDSSRYELMTAVPVNRPLPGDTKFSFKRMVPGSFITADVKGGEHSVEVAKQSLDQFFSDYRKTSMAIDFQMLITDRMKITDTTRWITRLYEPVF